MLLRLIRLGAAVALATATLAGAFAPTAAAAGLTTTLNFTGTQTVQSYTVSAICDSCAPDALFGGDNVGLGARVTIAATATWKPSATVSYQYSPSLLRKGQTLDLVDTLTGQSGPLDVTYSVSGDYGVYWNTTFPASGSEHGSDTSSFSLSTSGSGTCTLKLSGDGAYDCQSTDTIPIWDGDLFGIASAKINLPITTTISITPDGVATVRSITASSSTILGPDPLTFNGPSPSVLNDYFAVPCNAPTGADALYDLASTQTNPTMQASTDVKLHLEATLIITVGGDIDIGTIGPGPDVVMNLTAPSNQVDLGPLLANNVAPSVGAGGPYSGNEGAAITFDGSATTSVCPVGLTFVWNFSDGGIEYGKVVQHAFQAPGTFSGQLTVTDVDGNSATAQFPVTIANLAPAVSAGPDTTTAWGRSVAFNGSATDPGANDQSTLAYSWGFGDGSPSATGGASVHHAYALPGTYTATFTACDQWGACASDTRDVIVTKRDVALGYLGSASGTYDTAASFSASLVDQYGSTVNGRAVAFTVGAENEGTPATNSSGIASVSNVTQLTAGAYAATAAFGGDAMYNAATSSSASFTVGVKATTTTYTGALTGGPNKTIILSATLLDATNKPLAGRTMVFVLGAQTVSATTGATGVASASLKLNQKNGTYPVTATFTPAGADVSKYAGSGSSATFKLQAK